MIVERIYVMLKVQRKPRCVLVMICYHTHLWTPQAVGGIRTHLPEVPIVFINNNPTLDDSEDRKLTYSKKDPYGQFLGRPDNMCSWEESCELETQFIATIPNSQVVKTPIHFDHGSAMNFGMKWASENRYSVMVHCEPDTIIEGKVWYENLTNAVLVEDYWMAGGIVARHNELFSCPTAWNVAAYFQNNLSFLISVKTKEDLDHPNFHKVFNWDVAEGWNRTHWDTSLKAWYTCAKNGKAKKVDLPDFHHLWNGSQKR